MARGSPDPAETADRRVSDPVTGAKVINRKPHYIRDEARQSQARLSVVWPSYAARAGAEPVLTGRRTLLGGVVAAEEHHVLPGQAVELLDELESVGLRIP